MIVEEAALARRKIYRDGYDISVGEIISLYERSEIIVQPEFQRLFRWNPTQKTRFIESLILNIPFPAIFVFSDGKGRWELVDGLQRISTILEFVGKLKDSEGRVKEPFICDGTHLLPSLKGTRWPTDIEDSLEDDALPAEILPLNLRLTIRRARVRVEILSQETDARTKFELFQRLNSGGSNLSEQELRTCVIFSINKGMFRHIKQMADNKDFISMAKVGDERRERQYLLEMVIRFLVLRHEEYANGLDVHEYLDQGTIRIAENIEFDWEYEINLFDKTMNMLNESVGDTTFLKNGRFSIAMYEFISLGLSKLMEKRKSLPNKEVIRAKVISASDLPQAKTYSGIGVRGTQRLANFVIPMAENYFESKQK